MTRLLKSAPPLAHDRVVMDYDQRLMRRKLLTTQGGREFRDRQSRQYHNDGLVPEESDYPLALLVAELRLVGSPDEHAGVNGQGTYHASTALPIS